MPIPITHNKFLFINLFGDITRAIPPSVKGLEFFEIRWKLGGEGALSGLSLLGRVADFDSLHNLEIALKNLNLFVSVPQQQDLNFNFNLIIASNEGV